MGVQAATHLASAITGFFAGARMAPGPAAAAGGAIGAMAACGIHIKLSCLNTVLEMCDAVGLLPDDKDWRSCLKRQAPKVCTTRRRGKQCGQHMPFMRDG